MSSITVFLLSSNRTNRASNFCFRKYTKVVRFVAIIDLYELGLLACGIILSTIINNHDGTHIEDLTLSQVRNILWVSSLQRRLHAATKNEF